MFERIVAAIDSDRERATQVVNAAQEMGRAFGAVVFIAHVRQLERSSAFIAAGGTPSALAPVVHFETEESARELVNAAVDQLRQAGVTTQGEVGPGDGSTARELLDIARSHRADLIVVGDRDSRITDALLGGVSHRIVHLAECPVLLVR